MFKKLGNMQRSHGKIKKKKLILWRIALVKCERIV